MTTQRQLFKAFIQGVKFSAKTTKAGVRGAKAQYQIKSQEKSARRLNKADAIKRILGSNLPESTKQKEIQTLRTQQSRLFQLRNTTSQRGIKGFFKRRYY